MPKTGPKVGALCADLALPVNEELIKLSHASREICHVDITAGSGEAVALAPAQRQLSAPGEGCVRPRRADEAEPGILGA